MDRLAGKIAIITGAASANGIGYATARAFVAEGAAVLLTDIDPAGVAARAAEIVANGGRAIATGHDVRSEAGWDAVIDLAVREFGRLDILVNNAGIVRVSPIEDTTLESWEQQIGINLTGTFLGCRAAVRQLKRQGGGGAIVNLSSVAGLTGMAQIHAYCASKGGVRLLSKSLALELAPEHIRVNSVHPGQVWTDIHRVSGATRPEEAVAQTALVPMGHFGEPDDVARLVLFLASDEAKFITGGEYSVDGGQAAA